MKKGNRVLAMFLAVAMVFTSIAWDFSKAEAAETESAATEGGHVEYDFVNMSDVSSLDSAFTAYQNNAATPDASVADYWFIGKTGTGAVESNVEGLKPKNRGSVYCLVHNRTYEEFKLTVEMYPDTNTQVGIGQVTSSSVSKTTAGSLMIWFSSNKVIQYAGMGQSGSQTLSGSQTVYTVNIRLENGIVTIWVDGEAFSKSFSVDSSFPEQSKIVFRQKRNNDSTTAGKNGGYKSLEIRDLNAEGYTDFDNVDVNTLEEGGYTSTRFTRPGSGNYVQNGDADQSVSNHWFSGVSVVVGSDDDATTLESGNVGLKPNTAGNDNMTHLNTPYTYKNFRVSTEIYWGYSAGIVIGAKNAYPNDSSASAIRINFTGTTNLLRVIGAVDYSSGTATGTNAKWSVTGSGTGAYGGFTFTNESLTRGNAYTLIAEMRDGVLSVWVDGYDGVLTVKVADTYPKNGSAIALLAGKYDGDGGGLKSLDVQSLDDTYINFDNINLSSLDEKGYTSTRFTRPGSGNYVQNGDADQSVSNHWFSGADYSATYINAGLKPNTTGSNDMTHLNIPYTYKNFRVSAEIYWGYSAGIVIGEKNVYPNDSSASAIRINFTGTTNLLRVIGAVDYSSGTATGSNTTWTVSGSGTSAYGGFKFTSEALTKGEAYTLVAEMKDGVLSVWVEGYDGVLTVNVADTYPINGSSIALLASKYNEDGGGLKSLDIESLDDTYINFDNISLSTLDEKGYTSTRFTRPGSGNYVQNGDADQSVSNHWFSGADYSATYINAGLKPNTTGSNDMTHLNIPYTYKNFRVSAEIYWGYNAGIVIGEKNVYPNDSSASAIRVNFTGTTNLLRVIGAVDYSSGTATGSNAKWSITNSGAAAYGGFTFTNKSLTKGEAYTLNVEMKDGVLSVWVDEYDGVLTVKVADTYPTDGSSIALLASKYNEDGGGLKSCVVQEINTLSKIYTPKEFATYRSKDGYTAPSYHEYLFAGWYYDAACEEPVENDVTTATRCVYAKFVSNDILDVKAQISGNLYDTNGTNDKSGSIRFVTTVDSLDYNQVGFRISYDKGDGKGVRNVTSPSKKVYKKLYAIGTAEGEDTTYLPSDFSSASTYFKACTVPGITEDYYNVEFTVTSFWKTLDGTTVDGETVVKKINDQRIVSSVYVSDSGSDDNMGTYNSPYETLNHAIKQVADKGIVYVVDEYTGANDWEDHDKTITITSALNDEGTLATLDYTGLPKSTTTIDRSTLDIKDAVTFENIKIAFTDEKFTQNSTNYTVRTSVFAWGNPITIAEDVEMTGNAIRILGAGYSSAVVDRTELNLYAGTYMEIYGGGMSGTVTGNTNITIGPKVNTEVDASSHDHYYMLFGGGYDGTVNGNTNITIAEGANFAYIYGAGYGANTKVLGSTNIDFSGNAFSIYGGSYYGTNGNTNVVMNGGTVYQIFGGCEANSMEGNTNIKVVKGDVLRRIYGGCYNETNTTGTAFNTSYSVKGDTNVVIGSKAELTLAEDNDNALCAISRYNTSFTNEDGTLSEVGTLIFNRGSYGVNKGKILGYYWDYILGEINQQPYHYLVNASEGGEVVSVVDGVLTLTADAEYTATVTYGDNNTEITANADGTYTLPTVDKDSQIIVTVTFSK